MPVRLLAAVALTLAAAALPVPVASGRVVATIDGGSGLGWAGPVRAGDGTAYAFAPRWRRWRILRARDGGRARLIATATAPAEDWQRLALAGSPSHLVWLHAATNVPPDDHYGEHCDRWIRFMGGPADGPYAGLPWPQPESCGDLACGFFGVGRLEPVLAAATLVVGDHCAKGVPAISFIDVAAPTPAIRPGPDARADLRASVAAGRLVALVRDRVAHVLDVASGAEVAAYPIGGAALDAVQADGTIVTTTLGGRAGRPASWWSPAEPRAHRLGVRLLANETHADVSRIVGGRFAAETLRDDARLLLVPLRGQPQAIARVLPSDHGGWPAVLGLDFDGHRVAFATRTCDRVVVREWTPGSPPVGLRRLTCRAPDVVTRTAVVGRDRSFRLGITCRRGCGGPFEVTAHGGEERIASGHYALPPSTAVRWIRVRLTRVALRRLRGEEELDATVELYGMPYHTFHFVHLRLPR